MGLLPVGPCFAVPDPDDGADAVDVLVDVAAAALADVSAVAGGSCARCACPGSCDPLSGSPMAALFLAAGWLSICLTACRTRPSRLSTTAGVAVDEDEVDVGFGGGSWRLSMRIRHLFITNSPPRMQLLVPRRPPTACTLPCPCARLLSSTSLRPSPSRPLQLLPCKPSCARDLRSSETHVLVAT